MKNKHNVKRFSAILVKWGVYKTPEPLKKVLQSYKALIERLYKDRNSGELLNFYKKILL